MDGKYELVVIIVQTQGWCNLLSPPLFKKAKGALLSPQSVRLSVRPLCYLLLNHWTKFNQIWYVSYSHEWGVQRQTFFGPWALGRGQNVKYHLISITKSISKICVPNFVCVLTNERYKTYQTGFSFCCLGHAPGVDFGVLAVPRWSKIYFFKHGHVAYQIDGDGEQNGMQVTFSS